MNSPYECGLYRLTISGYVRACQGCSACVHAFRGTRHLLRFLSGKQDMYRSYYPHRVYDWRAGDFPEWVIMTDASYADDLFDRRTQGE